MNSNSPLPSRTAVNPPIHLDPRTAETAAGEPAPTVTSYAGTAPVGASLLLLGSFIDTMWYYICMPFNAVGGSMQLGVQLIFVGAAIAMAFMLFSSKR